MTLAEWFIEHPQIFKEWDSEVNTHITPETEGYAISKKAWWVSHFPHNGRNVNHIAASFFEHHFKRGFGH